MRRQAILAASACVALTLAASAQAASAAPAATPPGQRILPPGAIQHIMVIDLENEDFTSTFQTPGTYLHDVLEPQGEYVPNYYATGHVSLDNYIAQVSGQAPNLLTNSDCGVISGRTLVGKYDDGSLAGLDPDQATYPGQVDGQGCVYPTVAQTIGDQLDAAANPSNSHISWREYAEDMGNNPIRDGGQTDPTGGTDCAHPVQTNGSATDDTNSATAADQYATRHNPFMYFHSITDNQSRCDAHVVPLGTVTVGQNGTTDTFTGHLAQDLATPATTPAFSFVTPNLCNDGHDSPCVGPDTTSGNNPGSGGLKSANNWLSHWMPLILHSPAYQSGHMLVVLTSDEGSIFNVAAGDNEKPGPGTPNPGFSPLLAPFYGQLGITSGPGGGQIGALLLNPTYVHVGTTDASNTTYNHYSALRTYEDLLGLTTGGADGRGHLGFAATATPFGSDVFTRGN